MCHNLKDHCFGTQSILSKTLHLVPFQRLLLKLGMADIYQPSNGWGCIKSKNRIIIFSRFFFTFMLCCQKLVTSSLFLRLFTFLCGLYIGGHKTHTSFNSYEITILHISLYQCSLFCVTSLATKFFREKIVLTSKLIVAR